ncbi:helix-turn-helix transcriptional regulator [Methylobacterium bullatum]|nr:helix-turn-helix transcriptional regulator [Methylobacterium bullatum]
MSANDERRERLQIARLEANLSSVAIAAERFQIAQSTWRSHENGTREMTKNAALTYAKKLSLNFDWLWNGTGEMRATVAYLPEPNARPEPREIVDGLKTLPVVGRAKGGSGSAVVLDGTVTDHIPSPRSLDDVPGAYALEVVGESMEPRYFAGEIVYIHPTRTIHKGAHIVLQVRDQGGELHAYIKRYVSGSNEHVVVAQYNPASELRFERGAVEAMHLIVKSGIR